MRMMLQHLALLVAGAMTSTLPPLAAATAAPTAALRPPTLRRLPTGATRPAGWLGAELALQAKGLSGQLPYFWGYINGSGWVNPPATTKQSEPSQFVPYYLNGLVPLSYQVDDANVRDLRDRYVNFIVDRQVVGADGAGWLGPDIPANASSAQQRDYWSKYLAVEALESHAEANATDAPRVVAALVAHHRQFYKQMTAGLPALNVSRWGFARYSDGIVGIQWLLDRVPSTGDTAFLWDLLRAVRNESDAVMAAVDHAWESWYETGDPFKFPPAGTASQPPADPTGAIHLLRHGVDIGQAMKTGALWWRVDGRAEDWRNPQVALEWAEKFLHMPDGMYWADEEVGGLSRPGRGTETCSVVETMFSMRTAYEITGNVTFMDRVERLAFNALPAALWPDVTANVYHHAPNMLEVTKGPWSYGLYFCCSANVHQGWPKFVLSAVHTDGASGDVVVSGYSPSVSTLPDGRTVTVSGQYPFADEAEISVTGGGASSSSSAATAATSSSSLRLRIPCWVSNATVTVDGKPPVTKATTGNGGGRGGAATPCSFYSVDAPVGSTVRVAFGNEIRLRVWHNSSVDGQSAINDGAIEVHRGPLLFALRPATNVTESVVNPAFPAIKNRKVTATSQPWAFGIKPETLRFVVTGAAVPAVPFDADVEPPVKIVALARLVPSWTHPEDPPPTSPLLSTSPVQQIELVPYGSTNVRVSVFPQICERGAGAGAAKGSPPCAPAPPSPPPVVPPPNGQVGLNEPDNDLVPGGQTVGPAGNLTAAAWACFAMCARWNEAKKMPPCAVYTFAESKPSDPAGRPWCWLKKAANPKREQGFVSGECRSGTLFPCPQQ